MLAAYMFKLATAVEKITGVVKSTMKFLLAGTLTQAWTYVYGGVFNSAAWFVSCSFAFWIVSPVRLCFCLKKQR